MDEQEALDIAWQQNIDRVQAAKRGMRDAAARLAQVEQQVARACARRRFPTPEELERIDAAKAVLFTAREEHEAAKLNFKAGVSEEQIQAMIEET